MAARSLFLTLTRYNCLTNHYDLTFHFRFSVLLFSIIHFLAQYSEKLNRIFVCIFRNSGRGKGIPFRSISSIIGAVNQDPVTIAIDGSRDEFAEDDKDDLKSRIFRLRLPKRSVTNVLEKWVNEGRQITISDLRAISRDLRRSHRYKHALEVCKALFLIF